MCRNTYRVIGSRLGIGGDWYLAIYRVESGGIEHKIGETQCRERADAETMVRRHLSQLLGVPENSFDVVISTEFEPTVAAYGRRRGRVRRLLDAIRGLG